MEQTTQFLAENAHFIAITGVILLAGMITDFGRHSVFYRVLLIAVAITATLAFLAQAWMVGYSYYTAVPMALSLLVFLWLLLA